MLTADPILFSFRLYSAKEIVITPWTFIGLVANVLFTARVLIQWIASERRKKSIAPAAFWWTSLAATLIMVFYSIQRSEFPFLLGYTINIIPYVRNLMLSGQKLRGWPIAVYGFSAAVFVTGASVLALTGKAVFAAPAHGADADIAKAWLYVGLAGNLTFNTRFLAQWIYAEKKGKSALPMWFWIWSLTGQMLCLIYALILHDLVFILGFLFNGIPIIRNIMLCLRHQPSGAEH